MKNSILILCLSLALAIGCKKYPDGPNFSLKTPEKRLVGKWKVTSFIIKGEDQFLTGYYGGNTKLPCGTFTNPKYCSNNSGSLTSVTYEFKKDEKLTEVWINQINSLSYSQSNSECNCIYEKSRDESDTYEETWSFNKDKSKITIEYNGQRTEYEILKLTNNELSLYSAGSSSTKETRLTLSKQ